MIDIHLTVRLVAVSRGTAEPTRLRDPAELRRLEFRILHAARPHEEVQRDDRRSGEQRLGAGTEGRTALGNQSRMVAISAGDTLFCDLLLSISFIITDMSKKVEG